MIPVAPDAPSTPEVTDTTSRSVSLSWNKPRDDGGDKITGYIIEKKEPFSIRWTEVGRTQDTSFTVNGLKEGEELMFRVTAENRAGPGKASQESDKVVVKPPYGMTFGFDILLISSFLTSALVTSMWS